MRKQIRVKGKKYSVPIECGECKYYSEECEAWFVHDKTVRPSEMLTRHGSICWCCKLAGNKCKRWITGTPATAIVKDNIVVECENFRRRKINE